MAIISGGVGSFKKELLEGIHDFSADTIKAALYTSSASLGPTTTAYSATNEAVGTNYTAGGITMVLSDGYPATITRGGYVYGVVAFDDVAVSNVTVTFRAVLLYNSSKANRAIAVFDKGIDTVLIAGSLVLLNNPVAPYLIQIA